MEIQDLVNYKKEFYEALLSFIDSENENNEEKNNLSIFLEKQRLGENKEELRSLLRLIKKIGNNHYRGSHFIDKIEQIFILLEESIKQNFTNLEIYDIFKNNNLLLLSLYQINLLIFDDQVVTSIIQSLKQFILRKRAEIFIKKFNDHQKQTKSFLNLPYFYPELKSKLNMTLIQSVENFIKETDPEALNNFEERRKSGEQYSYISQLIRNDSLDDFILYMNQVNLTFSSKLKISIFETNSFLLNHEPTLIEYAAFFGSIQIFKYLLIKNAELNPSLWLFAVHGRNAEIIHLLEENDVKPFDKSYNECLKEAIKCHHNDIADYIIDNIIGYDVESENIEKKFDQNSLAFAFRYLNYYYFPTDFNKPYLLHYCCKYNYNELVKALLKVKGLDINAKVI
ncbi:hypothetical protein M9Y10_032041 [Tritrichomonas musculus]|uniref:DUF3447 domain-containing protein n=1 Tax=Tritrichomonas musculus TaxID=1915356 RepID=A0ABR2H0E8_9EUKA